MREFPHGQHDDGPDALEVAIRTLCEAAGMAQQSGPEWGDPF
jgi:hypothetical protein